MAISLLVVAAVCFLHLMAFVLAVGAEMRRSTGTVEPDEYDDRTYCVYDSDASTAYGLSAFGLVLVSQAVVSAVTRCLCCDRRGGGTNAAAGSGGIGGSRGCTVAAFVVSWLSFLVAEACLIAGSARNAYHSKYIGDYRRRDLQSCASLRKGVFAAAAAMVLVSFVSLLLYYWSYAKADASSWVRHRNDAGIGLAEYDLEKHENRNPQP